MSDAGPWSIACAAYGHLDTIIPSYDPGDSDPHGDAAILQVIMGFPFHEISNISQYVN